MVIVLLFWKSIIGFYLWIFLWLKKWKKVTQCGENIEAPFPYMEKAAKRPRIPLRKRYWGVLTWSLDDITFLSSCKIRLSVIFTLQCITVIAVSPALVDIPGYFVVVVLTDIFFLLHRQLTLFFHFSSYFSSPMCPPATRWRPPVPTPTVAVIVVVGEGNN